jgi:hypothetical protein
MPDYWPPAPKVLERPSADHTEYFPAGATPGKKTNKKKKQNSKTLNPTPIKSFSMPRYIEKTGGLPHCQMPATNLLRRCRKTGKQISRRKGLDAKGETPEQLRLKFYCS